MFFKRIHGKTEYKKPKGNQKGREKRPEGEILASWTSTYINIYIYKKGERELALADRSIHRLSSSLYLLLCYSLYKPSSDFFLFPFTDEQSIDVEGGSGKRRFVTRIVALRRHRNFGPRI